MEPIDKSYSFSFSPLDHTIYTNNQTGWPDQHSLKPEMPGILQILAKLKAKAKGEPDGVPKNVLLSSKDKRQMRGLEICCPFKAQGCTLSLLFHKMSRHIKTCRNAL